MAPVLDFNIIIINSHVGPLEYGSLLYYSQKMYTIRRAVAITEMLFGFSFSS